MSRAYRTVLCVAALIAVPIFAMSASAALLPPQNTGDLYLLEGDCRCLVAISSNGTSVSVLVSRSEIAALLAVDPSAIYAGDELAVADDGTIYFGIGANGGNFLVARAPGGALSVLVTPVALLGAIGSGSMTGLAIGADGLLYSRSSTFASVISIDPLTGAISILVTEAAIEALHPEMNMGIEPGITADANYVYVNNDNFPDSIIRISYAGIPELFSAGPGVDPNDIVNRVLAVWVSSGTWGGDFIYEISGEPENIPVGPIAWNATAAEVQAAFDAALPGYAVSVTGSGAEFDAWLIELLGTGWDAGVQSNLDGGTLNFDLDYRHIRPVQHQIYAVGTDGTSGTVSLESFVSYRWHPVPLTWSVGDDSATVESALEASPLIGSGDVSVSGNGTLSDPWVLEFVGNLVDKWVLLFPDPPSVDDGDVRVGALQRARAFLGVDGFLTRRGNGDLTVIDSNTIQRIDPAGNVDLFMSNWDFGNWTETGAVDAGLAFDDADNLYIVDRGFPFRIVRIEPDGSVSDWVTAIQIAAATGGIAEELGSTAPIAFERVSVGVPSLGISAQTTLGALLLLIAVWSGFHRGSFARSGRS